MKPIKHNIKGFCVCYAMSSIILGFQIYLGKEYSTGDSTAIGVVNQLIVESR